MGLTQVNTSSHLGQSYHVGRNINISIRELQIQNENEYEYEFTHCASFCAPNGGNLPGNSYSTCLFTTSFLSKLEQLRTTFSISVPDKMAAHEVEPVEGTFTQKPVQRELFIWKTIHEQYFVRELLLVEPYLHKQGSKERGQAWKLIASNLNSSSTVSFKVTERSVREKFTKMIDAFRKNENQEIKASGIQGKEYDEIYRALTDIHQRMKEAKAMWDKNSEREQEKEEQERRKVEDIRRKATERLGETRKRQNESEDDDEDTTSKKGGRGRQAKALALISESIQLKKEHQENDFKVRQAEIEQRKEERKLQMELSEQQHQNFLALQQQQQQFMLQMQQQQQMLMQQQQQQQMQSLNMMKDLFSSFMDRSNK